MLTRLAVVRTDHRDAGVTMIDVVVGMVLLTLVGMLSLRFMVNTSNDITRVGAKTFSNANSRAAVDVISSELRLVDTPTARAGFARGRFERLEANRVTFYANIDVASRTGTAGRTPPVKIDVYSKLDTDGQWIVKQDLYRPKVAYTNNYPTTYDYAANYPTTPSSTRLLLKPVRSATSLSFAYCTKATDPTITCTPALICPPAPQTCPSTTLTALGQDVAAVTVSLLPQKVKGVRSQPIRTTIAITGEVA